MIQKGTKRGKKANNVTRKKKPNIKQSKNKSKSKKPNTSSSKKITIPNFDSSDDLLLKNQNFLEFDPIYKYEYGTIIPQDDELIGNFKGMEGNEVKIEPKLGTSNLIKDSNIVKFYLRCNDREYNFRCDVNKCDYNSKKSYLVWLQNAAICQRVNENTWICEIVIKNIYCPHEIYIKSEKKNERTTERFSFKFNVIEEGLKVYNKSFLRIRENSCQVCYPKFVPFNFMKYKFPLKLKIPDDVTRVYLAKNGKEVDIYKNANGYYIGEIDFPFKKIVPSFQSVDLWGLFEGEKRKVICEWEHGTNTKAINVKKLLERNDNFDESCNSVENDPTEPYKGGELEKDNSVKTNHIVSNPKYKMDKTIHEYNVLKNSNILQINLECLHSEGFGKFEVFLRENDSNGKFCPSTKCLTQYYSDKKILCEFCLLKGKKYYVMLNNEICFNVFVDKSSIVYKSSFPNMQMRYEDKKCCLFYPKNGKIDFDKKVFNIKIKVPGARDARLQIANEHFGIPSIGNDTFSGKILLRTSKFPKTCKEATINVKFKEQKKSDSVSYGIVDYKIIRSGIIVAISESKRGSSISKKKKRGKRKK